MYWNCACLSVEASGSTDNPNKSISADYGEIAKAIYKMRQSNITVSAPDINQSDYEFTPVEETNNILFGLLFLAFFIFLINRFFHIYIYIHLL